MSNMEQSGVPAPPGGAIPAAAELSFAYRGQTADGQALAGTIDATGLDDARRRLEALGLRVLEMSPATPRKPRPLRGEDFVSFNQQLAQLAQAGLPLEQGLRLIAQDMRSGRLARTVNLVAGEMERGIPLGEAFARHQKQFPPLYGRLMDAGVRSGNLPAMLLNLSRHAELVQRLRAMLWQAVSYPLMVLVGLALVLLFLSWAVLPQFESLFKDFGVGLPGITLFIIWAGHVLPGAMLAVAIVVLIWFGLLPVLRRSKGGQGFLEATVLPLPLVGPVLRRSLIARWCDAVRLSVEAHLDLPAAVDLAAQAVASPALSKDGQRLLDWLSTAPPGVTAPQQFKLLPATVPAAIALAVRENQLATSLGTLEQMYQQQAEQRMTAIPAILGPALLLVITVLMGLILMGVVAPVMALLRAVSGPM